MGTINDKITYLDQTKKDIAKQIKNLGENIANQDTFRSYANKIKNVFDNLPKVTAEGTNFTLSPTKKGKMNITLKGNTEQVSYQGYNLVDVSPYQEETKNGVTLTKDSDGNIILNGTSTSAFGWNVSLPETRVLPAGTYTKSITKDSNIGTYLTVSIGYNGSSISGTSIQPSRGTNTMTFEQDTNYDQVRMYISKNTTFNNYKLSYMILSGEYTLQTIPDYEPYTGGQPSPNPDYPQDIHVVTGNNTVTVGSTNYPINLGSIELCKIGDYQDYLYKENSNWYKYGAIRKYTQTNAVNFSLRRVRLISSSELHDMGTSENPVNLPTPAIINISTSNNSRYNYGWGGLGFVFSQEEMDMIGVEDATEFKNYLDANLVAYVVIKPECDYIDITQITDETLISQLEAISNAMSSTGTTTISQTNADLPFIINATALRQAPSGTINITQSGNTDVTDYETATVSLETKSVTPSTSPQIIVPTSGYAGMNQVNVSAISTEQKTVKSTTSSQTVNPTSGKFINKVIVSPIVLENITINPAMEDQNITPTSGKDGISQVYVPAVDYTVDENIQPRKHKSSVLKY